MAVNFFMVQNIKLLNFGIVIPSIAIEASSCLYM